MSSSFSSMLDISLPLTFPLKMKTIAKACPIPYYSQKVVLVTPVNNKTLTTLLSANH